MGEAPQHPGEESFDLQAAEVGDGPFAADRRQRTEVAIAERRHHVAALARLQKLGDVAALLFCHRGDPGDGLAVGAKRERGIADDEDVGMAGDGEFRTDLDAPGLVGVDAEPRTRRRRHNPGRPDDGARLDPLGAEGCAAAIAIGDRRPQPHLDAQLLERALCRFRQRGIERQQQTGGSLDENDARLARIDRAKIGGERALG